MYSTGVCKSRRAHVILCTTTLGTAHSPKLSGSKRDDGRYVIEKTRIFTELCPKGPQK